MSAIVKIDAKIKVCIDRPVIHIHTDGELAAQLAELKEMIEMKWSELKAALEAQGVVVNDVKALVTEQNGTLVRVTDEIVEKLRLLQEAIDNNDGNVPEAVLTAFNAFTPLIGELQTATAATAPTIQRLDDLAPVVLPTTPPNPPPNPDPNPGEPEPDPVPRGNG